MQLLGVSAPIETEEVIAKTCSIRKRFYVNRGFTLLELIIIISILGILATIAIPSFYGYVEIARKEVCHVNCLQLENVYDVYLQIEEVEHSVGIFAKFLKEYDEDLCPKHGVIIYKDGKVQCSIHTSEEDEDEDEEYIPYL